MSLRTKSVLSLAQAMSLGLVCKRSPIIRRSIHTNCKFLSTKANKVEKPLSSVSQSSTADDLNQDDAAYFKRIRSTVNKYWIDNSSDLFQRLDWSLLVDLKFENRLKENLRRRLCDDKVDLEAIRTLWTQVQASSKGEERDALIQKLVALAMWIPNETHNSAMEVPDDAPLPIFVHGEPREGVKVEEFQKYCEKRNYLKNDNLGNLAFHRSYYLKGPLAELEDALVRYSLESIKSAGFQLISVPDILYPHVIESCGMKTRGDRDQIFWVELPDKKDTEACLSGTAEMAIAGSLQNRIFEESDLPLKLAAISRCYRAETSSVDEEKGLYRVHEFTKVELFGVTANETGEESNQLHQEIRSLEESNFSKLGLHFKTLEMPPNELGLPASRKFDIEAWMPGRKMYGEISSCSNCTDYQSRRLNIQYRPKNRSSPNDLKFAHTVNGTACAIPRMLIAIIENFQQDDGSVKLPSILNKHMSRSWEECVKSQPQFKSLFLRTKSSQEKYTKQFRKMDLQF